MPWKALMTSTRLGLLLAMALLSTRCVSLPTASGRGMSLRYAPHGIAVPALAHGESVTGARPEPRSALQPRQAVFGALLDVSGSTRRLAGELSRLEASKAGIAGRYGGVFFRYVDYGAQQLRWIDAELAAATRLAHTASEVEDPDMQRALLRLTGPRLEAALLGSLLLSAWVDFLHLTDLVLRQCPYYSVERLVWQMDRLRKMIDPAMTALASLEPGQVEAAAKDLPALMGHLTGEFAATREAVRVAAERFEQMLVVKELLETLGTASVLKAALCPGWRPPLPPRSAWASRWEAMA
jgi:hypothetical protein